MDSEFAHSRVFDLERDTSDPFLPLGCVGLRGNLAKLANWLYM